MKLLLFGAGGQVGWELQRALAPLGELTALHRGDIDFKSGDALQARVEAVAPQAIVNAAAYTAVDRAETEPEFAHAINAAAPARLARAARSLGAWLVHYSTDYVFDGSGDAPRDEDAATAPLNVYGRTKLDGERAIRAANCRHLILRTSWVYAARGGNFARTMLGLAAERERLSVVADQVGAPTGAELIADATAHALRVAFERPGVSGTYHLVAGGETSWHGYAMHVIDAARRAGRALTVQRIDPIATRDWPTPAARPLNSRLATRKFAETFGLSMPPWQAGVDRMLAEVLGE